MGMHMAVLVAVLVIQYGCSCAREVVAASGSLHGILMSVY